MSGKKSHQVLLKLKKQVRLLQRKEEHSRNQLRSALKKIQKLGKFYKSKLAGKVRVMKGKIAKAQASTYAKVATDIQRQMLKNVEAKAKSLRSAISKFEKKHIAKLTKSLNQKSKKVGKGKSRTKIKKNKRVKK